MTDRLGGIEARLAAATPGPWEWTRNIESNAITGFLCGPFPGESWIRTKVINPGWTTSGGHVEPFAVSEGDAEFIAHAPDDIAWLVAQIRAANEALAGLVDAVTREHRPSPIQSLRVREEMERARQVLGEVS